MSKVEIICYFFQWKGFLKTSKIQPFLIRTGQLDLFEQSNYFEQKKYHCKTTANIKNSWYSVQMCMSNIQLLDIWFRFTISKLDLSSITLAHSYFFGFKLFFISVEKSIVWSIFFFICYPSARFFLLWVCLFIWLLFYLFFIFFLRFLLQTFLCSILFMTNIIVFQMKK